MAFGGILSAAVGIGSSLLGAKSQSSTNRTNAASVADTNISNLKAVQAANAANKKITDKDRALQREFAQHGTRWKVEDARAAGIHPLYSLGGSGATYTPSAIPMMAGRSDAYQKPRSNLAQNMGQDITRAIDSTRTSLERRQARADTLMQSHQQRERNDLENDLLRAQIAKLTQSQTGPAFPSAIPTGSLSGQGNFEDPVTVERVRTPAVRYDLPQQEAGGFPETRYVRTKTGYQPVPHPEAYEDADLMNPSAMGWTLRNQLLPSLGLRGSGDPPPDRLLPPKAEGWEWSVWRQNWEPYYGRRPSFFDWSYGYYRGRRNR